MLSVVRAPDFDAVIDLVNRNEYGNGTAIFTRDGDDARTFAHDLNTGMVRINVPDPGADGVPQLRRLEALAVLRSSHARSRGRALLYAAESYTRQKAITSRWPTGIRAGGEFKMPTTG